MSSTVVESIVFVFWKKLLNCFHFHNFFNLEYQISICKLLQVINMKV